MTTPPPLTVLLPAARSGEQIEHEAGDPDLSALYEHPLPSSGRSVYLRTNFVATLDGAAQGSDGRSGTINNAADLRAFRLQRAHADVVLAGAGTVRAEHYGAPEVAADLVAGRAARGQSVHLPLAVVTSSGALPEDLLAATRPPLVLAPRQCQSLDALRERIGADNVLVAGDQLVEPASALAALAERGLTRVLCEGGPELMGRLVTAGVVDELCLTTVPLLVGGPAKRVLDTPDWLDPARPARLAHLLHSEGTLLSRWLLRQSDPPRSPTCLPLGSPA